MSIRNVCVIIPAAGSSRRMGAQTSKLFERLGDCLVIERTIHAFGADPRIARIVVLCRPEDIGTMRALSLGPVPVEFVDGGSTRQQSVANAVSFLRAGPQPEIVAVHDAARCLVSSELVSRCIDGAIANCAITAAVPLVDSLKRVDASYKVVASVPREHLWLVQTPQVFTFELLVRAHTDAGAEATDDASLVERFHPVMIVEGERRNLKITTPEDLLLARRLIGEEG